MSTPTFIKDPAAQLDYAVDWASWLQASETITTSTWTLAAGITQGTPGPSNTTTKATIWLTGGTAGVEYLVTNRIVTNQGRTDERSINIAVQER